MNETAIAWTDHTWNLFSGCKKISPECAQCYAHTLAERHRGNAAFPHGFDLTVRPHKLSEPAKLLRSKGPALIFCESMSDIGLDDDELTPAEVERLRAAGYSDMGGVRDDFFDAIEETPEHRYQVLTKRPETLMEHFKARGRRVPESVWLGVTIGHPKSLGRLDVLRRFRDLGARVLFVSAEPLLGDLVAAGLRLDGIHWIIVGGESGQHAGDPRYARRFLVARAAGGIARMREPRDVPLWRPTLSGRRSVVALRDEADRVACASFFFKQWGGPRPESGGRLLDGRTWDEMPDHVPGAMPARRVDLRGAATAALARKLPVVTP